MSIDAGEVTLRAALRDGVLRDVTVGSRRPQIAGLLAGRTPEDLQAVMPLVFSICGRAHAAAVYAAASAARGHAPATAIDPAVSAEAARELMLSVCAGDLRTQVPALQRSLAAPGELLRRLESDLLGIAARDFLSLADAGRFAAWSAGDAPLQCEARRRLAEPEPPVGGPGLLPVLEASRAAALPIDAAFAARPRWMDAAAETGAYARQHQQPLLTSLSDRPVLQRWLARLLELLSYAMQSPDATLGRVSAATTGAGSGLAAVETARGTLLHALRVRSDRVAGHVIVAPTEWNFHSDGLARFWLEGRPAASSDAATRWMQRVAEALDPCVACRLLVD